MGERPLISAQRTAGLDGLCSQNYRSRKSRFRAPNLICAGSRHDVAHARATRQDRPHGLKKKLPNFPSRTTTAFYIVIDAKKSSFSTQSTKRTLQIANRFWVKRAK
jgi:hypothetical protein